MASRERTSRGTRPQAAPALPSFLVLLAFAVLLAATLTVWSLPLWAVALYVVASVVCFGMYAVDKRAAGSGRQRISENTLHLLALVGGWPGAILAQQTLRHKTAKRAFRRVFWITVALNVVAFVALATPLIGALRKA